MRIHLTPNTETTSLRGTCWLLLGLLLLSPMGLADFAPCGCGSQAYGQDDDDDGDVDDGEIPTTAGTFYVRTRGDDANSGTNVGQAFRTLRRAALMAPAGSTIHVGAGTYTASAQFLGLESTASKPLRVIADVSGLKTGDRGAVILGPGTRLSILGCDHVVVSGFTFQGPTSRCFEWRRSTGGLVQDCTFIGGTNGVKIRSGDVKFQDCTVKEFVANGIDVYGTSEVFMVNCTIEKCGAAGLEMNEYGRVTIESSNFRENTGDGISVQGTTSTDDGIFGQSGNQLLVQARNLLEEARPSATDKGQDKIDDAIEKLDEALEPKHWLDAWHPHSKLTEKAAKDKGIDAKDGKEVFKKTGDALDKLKDFLKNDPKKDEELGNFGIVKTNVNLAHLWMLEATRTMAELALQEALLAGVDAKELEKIQKEFKKAEKEIDKGHLHHAAKKFGKAWEKAAEAADSQYGAPPKTDGDNDNPSDAEAKQLLTISSSNFRKNSHGIRCGSAQKFSMRASDLSENTLWGLYVAGTVKIEDCTITDNGDGVCLKDVADSSNIKRLKIKDNDRYGLFAQDSSLELSSTNIADWDISGSQYVIAGKGSDISLQNLTISGGSVAGLQVSEGNMKAYLVKFTGNGTGLAIDDSNFALYECTLFDNTVGLHAEQNKSMTVQKSVFSDNKEWGVKLSGRGKFTDSTISGNGTGGIELTNTSASELSMATTSVTDNNTYGLYCSGSALLFDAANFGGLKLSGHDYQIYGDNGSDLAFAAFTVTGGKKYAVYIANSKLSAKHSTFTGAGTGLGAYLNSLCILGNCTFTKNTDFGLHLGGNAVVTDCTIEGNGSGVLFEDTNSTHTTTFSNNTIKDNANVGVYAKDAEMTFNTTNLGGTTITGSKTVFAGFESLLTFDGITISGGSEFGIANYSGKVAVDNCTVSDNGTGLYSDYGCTATGSTFSGNTAAGASVVGVGIFTDCVFEKNPNGLQITDDTTGAVKLVTSQIRDNTLYGVWFDGCTLTFDSSMQTGWNAQNNGSNFGATGSALTFDGFNISGGTTYGVVCESGTLKLNYSTLTGNGTGAYVDAASTLNASGARFTGNTLYGASIQGKADLSNCTFDGNTHGLQFANMAAGEFNCNGTTVSNNSQYGLHLESCTLTLTGNGISGLTISNNGYGIHSTNSTLVFDNFISQSNTYGAWLDSSDVTMTNSEFSGSTYGLWATNNSKLDVDSSTFSGNSAYGVYLIGTGSFHNCSITGNASGLYLNTINVTDANLSGTDISGNTSYGVYAYKGSLNLSSQAAEGWTIGGNGYNVASYEADLSLIDATLTGANSYGVYAEYGNVDVQRSTITSKSGGVWSWYTDSFNVDRSRISGSSTGSWGVVNYDAGMTMRNSVVSGSRYGVFSYDTTKTSTIYNSTIADATEYGLYAYSGDLTVMNTIISGTNGGYGLYRGSSAGLTHSYNLVHGFATPFYNTAAHKSEVEKSPRFSDPANGDYSLGKGSPAINAGVDLTASHTIDLDGNSRPSHKVFEIGAYEFTGDAGSFRVLDWQEKAKD